MAVEGGYSTNIASLTSPQVIWAIKRAQDGLHGDIQCT
jgi:hypothetical protein